MKKEVFADIIGDIDDKYLNESEEYKKSRPVWDKIAIMAASFAIVIAAIFALPHFFKEQISPIPPTEDTTQEDTAYDSTDTTEIGGEGYLEKVYNYKVVDGKYSTYFSGKVIPEQNISNKLEDVTVHAFWISRDGVRLNEEMLRADVYSIDGVVSDIAVALKFIDKGDALTTTHYYTILNPEADLSSVDEYIISPTVPNNTGDEMAFEEIIHEETVTE